MAYEHIQSYTAQGSFSGVFGSATTGIKIVIDGPGVIRRTRWTANNTPGTTTGIVVAVKRIPAGTGVVGSAESGATLTTAVPPVAGKTYYKNMEVRLAAGESAAIDITTIPTAGQGILAVDFIPDGFHEYADTTNLIASTT